MRNKTAKLIEQYGRVIGMSKKRLRRAFKKLPEDKRAEAVSKMSKTMQNLKNSQASVKPA
jgi:hypothetical protein